MRTLAVAFSPPTHPITGDAMFELDEDEMAVGMGQHGEAGVDRVKMRTADETTELMLEQLLADLGAAEGEELLVILNGAGATTMMELYIVFRRMHQILKDKKIKIARSLIGEYITTQEQAGFQMLIAAMDREMLNLWDAPCDSPCLVTR
jgi:dihydroxyacetone kinase-like protein